jgi:preprotein translocase subunit SecG
MISFLYVLYVMVCLFLILVVLLQAGRGGMGAAFGGSSQTVFGSSGAGNFLTRLTVISAVLFMMLSATLTYVSSSGEKSLENASERIRLREEASTSKSKDAKDTKKDGAKPAASEPTDSKASAAPSGAEPAPAPAQDALEETRANEDEAPAASDTKPSTPAAPANP